ncbi:MAG: hypothetical protein HY368_02425, partial [Candidatus Aenigmarchaeota archaeon]|nr:hypothetical protein [Candidatus Aenigmarchaeota archaeon]
SGNPQKINAEIAAVMDATANVNSSKLVFYTQPPGTAGGAPTERMRINSTGSVSIGSADAGKYKLNVNGDVNASAYVTNGTDYGEIFEKLDAGESIEAGDIVAVVSNRITKPENLGNTDATLYMVATDTAGVLGNAGKHGIPVAFVGKVGTKVSGAVSEGDYILADGTSTGYAKARDDVTFDEFKKKVIGVALESKNDGGTRRILVAVGVK